MRTINKIKAISGGLFIFAASMLSLNSCSENIDDSDLYTFTGETMVDHFENDPENFSDYLTILGKVHPSKRSESTMLELLSARGNYTCFAPTNDAIKQYLDSLLLLNQVTSTDVNQIPDSIAESIVFNSIIENENEEAYSTTDFVEGALSRTNMNDRYINISYGNDVDGTSVVFVNVDSRIIVKDIEVTNGYIHAIDKVLSPSTATVGDLVMNTPNTSFFGRLLDITGWDDQLMDYRDEAYEDFEKAGEDVTEVVNGKNWDGRYPEHRYFGYTVFVETDSVFEEALGKDNLTVEALKNWLQTNGYYPDANYDDDYTSEDNVINQFVSYHLLPERLTWNRMVIFSNEKGFYNGAINDGTQFQTNVWEYYETMGKHRRTLKITGIKEGKRINRYSTMNLTTYREQSVEIPGVEINSTNGQYDNNAMNGYYYTINSLLLWGPDVYNKVLNERMRYDICALLPEIMTNNVRFNKTASWFFKSDYFDVIPSMSEETVFQYLPNTNNTGDAGQWTNYQTDEFNIKGVFDFTMKLPPVPYTGTYEIRYGVSANGNRGMAQIYLGTNPNNLPPVGIPLDLRVEGTTTSVGWVSDTDLGSDEAIDEKDKAMRNLGYMKGPKYFYPASGISGRDCRNCLRRIIFTGQLEAGETYYIRFKSVLQSSAEFFFDYLEIVPKTIYNGEVAEDKW